MTHDTRDIVRQTAGFIATALGASWRVEVNEGAWGATILGPDGARLYLRLGTYGPERDRLVITGEFPCNSRNESYRPRDGSNHQITVARDRDPGVIAREITRRLLPGYYVALRAAFEAVERDNAGEREREAASRVLSAAPAVSFRDSSDFYLSLRSGYGKGSVAWGGSVRLDLSSLTIDQAERVLLALAE